ncbi:MAG: glycosyltransferase family 4 protein [Bacteriovoracaceae bacterium]|nr:glycosyltransferase family 4 protein [Bacteriovoracaceae bacterium]
MKTLKFKNIIRVLVGIMTSFIPTFKARTALYCNLRGGSVYGGPNRFLKNILSTKSLKSKAVVSHWSLRGCRSSLVFSASWGDSFSKICKILGVKSVLRVDGFYVPEDKVDGRFQQDESYRNWVNYRLSKDLEKFDHVIYQSHFSKAVCDEYLFERTAGFSIIHNGTNTDHFSPQLKPKNSPIRLLMLGKHYPKHIELGLKVMKNLPSEKYELHIIGPMRNGEDIVAEFLENIGLEGGLRARVICHGVVNFDSLPKKINECHILLHAKVGDWCPNAAIEALSCGLPVVCPKWGGTAELVSGAGVSVEGEPWVTDEDLARRMAKAVLEVEGQVEMLSKRAREVALSNFNIEKVSLEYLKVLNFT